MTADDREVFVAMPPDQLAALHASAARRMFPEEIAEAEARGYRRAVTKLRHGQRIADLAWQANTAILDLSLGAAADYLEATEGDDR